MKWALVSGLVGLAMSNGAPAFGQTKASQMVKSKGWHADLETARSAARKLNKPLMVVFRCDP